MTTVSAEEQTKPIKVQVVATETAQRERKTITMTYTPPIAGVTPSGPICILPLSNKRIHAIISVTGVGVAYLCTSQSQAMNVTATYNAGAIVGPGTFEVVGSGELWLIAVAAGVIVGVIAEYEA
jgi:hypothetical protein